jgi:hypothetical protein
MTADQLKKVLRELYKESILKGLSDNILDKDVQVRLKEIEDMGSTLVSGIESKSGKITYITYQGNVIEKDDNNRYF